MASISRRLEPIEAQCERTTTERLSVEPADCRGDVIGRTYHHLYVANTAHVAVPVHGRIGQPRQGRARPLFAVWLCSVFSVAVCRVWRSM